MLEKLILYFVVKTKGNITKTQLIKFLYLADLYAVKWTGKPLTELDWCYYHYGPWHEEIEKTLNSLAESNRIELKPMLTKNDQDAILVTLNGNEDLTGSFDFSLSLELMLDNIRKEWAGSGKDRFNNLLEYVYDTEPMKEARQKHQPEEKALLNLKLEHEKLLTELGV
jgi:hypothetical protein